MRPLGIPSFRDKLLQEVIRMLLEAIYEPVFSDFSHGFRLKRSCHTALGQAKCYFTGAKWFVEGDIKGCFDNINHAKLIEILERKIKDSKFINVIRSFLKAGYLEDWTYHGTYTGCPQGGVLSPILSNIYLNELDNKISEIKENFDTSPARHRNPEYRATLYQAYRREKALGHTETEQERQKLLDEIRYYKELSLKLPAKLQIDKKVSYVRYADDFLIAVHGSKEDCIQIKAQLAEFLNNELKLTLSEEKTLITHSSNNALFLGYDISVRRNNAVKTDSIGRKQRFLSGTVQMN